MFIQFDRLRQGETERLRDGETRGLSLSVSQFHSLAFRTYIIPMRSRLFAILRTLVVATLFVSLWTFFAPRWMAMSKHVQLDPILGWHLIPMLIGGAMMIRCCWD